MTTKSDEVSRADALQYAINLIGHSNEDFKKAVVKSLTDLKKTINNRNAKERARRARNKDNEV